MNLVGCVESDRDREYGCGRERQRSGPVEAETGPDELVRDAAASCPSEAISLVDAGTRQPVDLD